MNQFANYAHAHMRLLMVAFFMFFGMVSVGITLLINGSALETRFFPVNVNYQVTSIAAEGTTVVLRGKLTVRRQCDYVSPPQAKTKDGMPLEVRNGSRFANQDFVAGERYAVGPWYIADGVGHELVISQNHHCHGLWVTVTRLGTIDARHL